MPNQLTLLCLTGKHTHTHTHRHTHTQTHANINSNARADNFSICSGEDGIKRSSYVTITLLLTSLTTLVNEALKSKTGYTDFKAWKVDLEKTFTTSKYWFTVIEVPS